MRAKIALTLLGVVLAASLCRAETYTYLDLIRKLTDLESLALAPKPGVKCAQWSSYDRASKYDEATGSYVGWDANGDGGGIIRREEGKQVFAEIEGPGVIWRTWSAAPQAGRVRIYLDGAPEPAVDLKFSEYFDRTQFPFVYPALVHDASSGKNLYVPLPFRKSCKIVADDGWGAYFHFTYTTYPKDTVVPVFTRMLTGEEYAALDQANAALTTGLGSDPAGPRAGERAARTAVSVRPGRSATLARITGERAITALRVKVNGLSTRADETLALRELALKITFDDESSSSVWAPLGDFFGTAPGVNRYKSLPLGMTDDGFYSFWFMPFARKAVVEVVNDGPVARSLTAQVTHAPLARPAADYARFHAKWHRDAFLPKDPGRNIEWTMVTAEGAGRFVGVNLHVWNPKGGWWGEGDEMFYVDGEKFPSTIGTGSEDYFGYAWCNPTPFFNSYHNQPFNSGNNKGHASVNRWHITDNVPFLKSFIGTIEKYYPNNRPTLYAATAYWYLMPGGTDPYAAQPLDQRLGYFELNAPEPFAVRGALEGETMKVLSCTGGGTQAQGLSDREGQWSKDTQLWWTEGKPGDKLTLALPVAAAGRYAVRARFTKAIDYGIVQLWLDGRKLGEAMDFFNDGVIPTDEMDLGVVELTKGEHQLTAEIVGTNEKAVRKYMFGLDYVRLEAR